MSTTDEKTSQTLILGLGNELRGDDAVGILVVRELRRRLKNRPDVSFEETNAAGMALLDVLQGYRDLILVDAIRTRDGQAGAIYRLSEDDLPAGGSLWTAHRIGLKSALETGRRCGCPVPARVIIYAVEAAESERWSDTLSEPIRRAVPVLVERIVREQLRGGD